LAATREASSSQVLSWNLLRESSTVEEGQGTEGHCGLEAASELDL